MKDCYVSIYETPVFILELLKNELETVIFNMLLMLHFALNLSFLYFLIPGFN